jgi:hypothetical protein
LTAAEKAETFLAPKVASKIGLVEVKVVEKPKRQQGEAHSPSPELKHQELKTNRESLSLEDSHGQLMMSQALVKNQSISDIRRGLGGLR